MSNRFTAIAGCDISAGDVVTFSNGVGLLVTSVQVDYRFGNPTRVTLEMEAMPANGRDIYGKEKEAKLKPKEIPIKAYRQIKLDE